jgi:hypothetical protein
MKMEHCEHYFTTINAPGEVTYLIRMIPIVEEGIKVN